MCRSGLDGTRALSKTYSFDAEEEGRSRRSPVPQGVSRPYTSGRRGTEIGAAADLRPPRSPAQKLEQQPPRIS